MKKLTTFTMVLAALVLASSAGADSLSVNATAAMAGTNFGLEVLHDNTSIAFVQDDSPNSETIYRFEVLYNPNFIGPTGSVGYRFTVVAVLAANPRPNNPANPCPLAAHIPVFPARIFAVFGGPTQNIPLVRLTMMSNFCGIVGTPGIIIPDGQTSKLCAFVEIAPPGGGAGTAGMAAVGEFESCPPNGDPAYRTVQVGNEQIPVTGVRLGNIAINPSGAGENGSFYLDEFSSFRTLAP